MPYFSSLITDFSLPQKSKDTKRSQLFTCTVACYVDDTVFYSLGGRSPTSSYIELRCGQSAMPSCEAALHKRT